MGQEGGGGDSGLTLAAPAGGRPSPPPAHLLVCTLGGGGLGRTCRDGAYARPANRASAFAGLVNFPWEVPGGWWEGEKLEDPELWRVSVGDAGTRVRGGTRLAARPFTGFAEGGWGEGTSPA